MKPQNKEVDFTFYPTKDFKECPVCGICSFPHIHRKGTLPKDFERIEPENKSTNEPEKVKMMFILHQPIGRIVDNTEWQYKYGGSSLDHNYGVPLYTIRLENGLLLEDVRENEFKRLT